MDPKRLLAELDDLIAGYDAQIEKQAAVVERATAELAALRNERERHRQARVLLAGDLTGREQSHNIRGMGQTMTETARVQHSKAMVRAMEEPSPLLDYANRKNLTLNMLAPRVECSASLLSMDHAGKRSIKESICKRVQKETGLPATKKNWPLMRVGE